MSEFDARISEVSGFAFTIPTNYPEADGTLAWDETTLVLARVVAGGVTGIGWTYASTGCRNVIDEQLANSIRGLDVLDVPRCHDSMVIACRNLGRPGLAGCAISAVDTALWDCKARLLGLSLSALLGSCREAIDIYGSGGFTTYDERTATEQLERWIGLQKIPRVKIKIGESWGSREARDLERVRHARRVIGDQAELYVDANGAYTRKQAVRLGRCMIDDANVVWFEEPVSSDDLTGLRAVSGALSLDVAAGEYGYDEIYFARMLEAKAVDCLQIDVTRCGGYTSWLRTAAIAATAGTEVSAHCAPNLHAHVCAGVPNMRHIEYFWDHERIEGMLFDGVLDPTGGALKPDRDAPGHGLTFKAQDAQRFAS